ncbi:hypothetical protein ACIHIX_39310 [Streptomyces sp. NPDC051913]|uniref:hypothetical protein n=1 Tax=Streptomyces sp. NPDC051913 TaxID=3365676 RepID=UPI0037D25E2D
MSHVRRAGHLKPFEQPCEFAGERVLVAAADHDLDAAFGRGAARVESIAESDAYVIAPKQRGYGTSSRPAEVTD